MKAIAFGADFIASAQCALRKKVRGTLLEKLCGLQEKGFRAKEAIPGERWVKRGLKLGGKEVLSQAFPCGERILCFRISPISPVRRAGPEGLVRYGESWDKRGDRRQVFVVDCDPCTRSFDFS
ncbi:hypothetical protein [Candidatus Methylacidithermus pantelleriae]|uniref:hypothetical protein n=1 Tax=Candidatus Methylacidithermus pantelleriae TaxID=2744239 RepID=UPI00157DD736|nr:hypothetical protein [Candidatus Methylacidithermus pantelleriae]